MFIFLTAIFTFPLILNFNTAIPGFHSTDEPYGVLWNFWWLKYSHLQHLKDNFSPFIASPFGLNLAQSPAYPIGDFINKFLTLIFGEIIAYNLQVVISFILSAIFMYYLVYGITHDRLTSIFSGIIYSFSSYHTVRSWQHPSLAQIQWLPLYLWALFNLREKSTLKNMIFTAISFCFIAFFNYYYAYFSLIITLAFIIFIFVYDKKGYLRIARDTLISMSLAFLILLPIILPIFKAAYFTQRTQDLIAGGYFRTFNDLFEQSARPLSYFLPDAVHPIFGKFSEQFIGLSIYGMSFTEHALYLGWTSLIFAFIAFRKWRRNKKLRITSHELRVTNNEDFYIGFFIWLAIVAWFFSQPPWWEIGAFKIYMPSFFMYKIFPMFRAYCRFGVVVMLAVAVLAGVGLKFILEKFNSQKTKVVITALSCGLFLFESWNWPPFKVINVSGIPAVYYWLKAQPGDFIIAEYPLDVEGANEIYKFYQTRHEKKIINATIPGTYPNKVAKSIIKLSDPNTPGALRWMKVKYVLVHRDGYQNTELIEWTEELDKVAKIPGLKFIKSFTAEECPQKGIRCIQEAGPIDVYEVIAQPIKPEVEE